MKISFSRAALLATLQVVARATATRSAIQALSGILLTAGEESVELAATDAEIALRSTLDAEVDSPGTLLVPGRLMAEIVRALDSDEVALEHRAERGDVEVTAGQTRFALKSLPVEDFPKLPEMASPPSLSVPATAFARTIERVAKAASRDETRPVLTGILVSVGEEGQLRMVATDSYRLSVKETQVSIGESAAFEANVPARALQELSRIVSDGDSEQLAVAAHDNQIVFSFGPTILSSRMIEGQFPNYQQLLPDSYEHEVRVERGEFLGVVRRVSLMAQRNAPLRLKFEDGSVTVSAQTPDVGEASESLPVNYGGEQLEIGFNPQFLQEGIEAVDSDEMALRLISPLRPGLIEGVGEGSSAEGDRFLYLIMPVRLNV
jgi:DNA polymerase III subunit beta